MAETADAVKVHSGALVSAVFTGLFLTRRAFFLKLCACLVLFHQYKKCHSSRSTLCPSVTDGSPLIQEAPFFFFFFKLTGGNPRVICTVLVYWMLLLLINCGANFNIVHVVCCKEYFYLIVYFLFLFISPCYWYAFWSGTNYTWLERDTVTSWGTGRVWFCSVTLKSVTSVCQLPMLKVSVIENIINVVIKQ